MSKNNEQKKESGGDGAISDASREKLIMTDPDAAIAELQEKVESQPAKKRGRPKKQDAEDAAQADLLQLCLPTLSAINAIAGQRVPEFLHSEDEVKAIAFALSRVLAKHMDSAVGRYQDEILLAMLLGGSLVDKGIQYTIRKRREKPVPKPVNTDNSASRKAWVPYPPPNPE